MEKAKLATCIKPVERVKDEPQELETDKLARTTKNIRNIRDKVNVSQIATIQKYREDFGKIEAATQIQDFNELIRIFNENEEKVGRCLCRTSRSSSTSTSSRTKSRSSSRKCRTYGTNSPSTKCPATAPKRRRSGRWTTLKASWRAPNGRTRSTRSGIRTPCDKLRCSWGTSRTSSLRSNAIRKWRRRWPAASPFPKAT